MNDRQQLWEMANAAMTSILRREAHAMWYLRWSKGMTVVEIAEAFEVPPSGVDATLESFERDRVDNVTLQQAARNVLRLPRRASSR